MLGALGIAAACAGPPPPPPVVVVVPVASASATVVAAEPPPLQCRAGMALVPGGTLRLASKVFQIADFCLDVHEVTTFQYQECVFEKECDDEGLECDEAWTYGKSELADHPINCVTWSQAQRYCRAAGKRLPVFEESEWVMRGRADGDQYPWGPEAGPDHLCWSLGGQRTGTCAVGEHPLSRTPEGIDDLFGNVWEWLSPAKRGGVANVARGSSWHNDDIDAPGSENGGGFTADFDRNDVVGFRCALGR